MNHRLDIYLNCNCWAGINSLSVNKRALYLYFKNIVTSCIEDLKDYAVNVNWKSGKVEKWKSGKMEKWKSGQVEKNY